MADPALRPGDDGVTCDEHGYAWQHVGGHWYWWDGQHWALHGDAGAEGSASEESVQPADAASISATKSQSTTHSTEQGCEGGGQNQSDHSLPERSPGAQAVGTAERSTGAQSALQPLGLYNVSRISEPVEGVAGSSHEPAASPQRRAAAAMQRRLFERQRAAAAVSAASLAVQVDALAGKGKASEAPTLARRR